MTSATRIVRPRSTRTVHSRKKKKVNRSFLLFLFIPMVLLIAMTVTTIAGLSASNAVEGENPPLNDEEKSASLNVQALAENREMTSQNPVADKVIHSVSSTDRITPVPSREREQSRYTDEEVALIAKTLYGEARGIASDMEVAAVAWCILNRVDAKGYACGNSIEYVVTFRNQFHGYNESYPITERLERITRDVLDRWYAEKDGSKVSGRVLPAEYIYFVGSGGHNWFTTEYQGTDYYDWSLPNPYEN